MKAFLEADVLRQLYMGYGFPLLNEYVDSPCFKKTSSFKINSNKLIWKKISKQLFYLHGIVTLKTLKACIDQDFYHDIHVPNIQQAPLTQVVQGQPTTLDKTVLLPDFPQKSGNLRMK